VRKNRLEPVCHVSALPLQQGVEKFSSERSANDHPKQTLQKSKSCPYDGMSLATNLRIAALTVR